MKTIYQRRKVTSSGRLMSIAVVALGASTVLALTATKASAFDLGGMVGTVIAMRMQMGAFGYRGAPSGHSRSHVASQHDSDGSGGGGGGERDARDAAPTDRTSKVAARQSFGSSGSIRQASERDASAGQSVASDRSTDDVPAYRPSR
jgi:hypothetical protein